MKIINSGDYITEKDLNSLSHNEREYMYNGLDCCVTLEILYELEKQLDNVTTPIYNQSMDMRAPILEMSMHGIKVDEHRRNKVKHEFIEHRDRVKERFERLCEEGIGTIINWRSDHQVKRLFYGVLGIKPIKKRNDKGQFVPTVNRDALERLQVHFLAQPLISHILFLRDIQKKIDFLNTGIDPDGRMRATFNIAGTNTGRLSSSESEFGTGTNQQNIDRSLRSIFIPDPGYKFINIDLEQGDSRNLGAMCYEVFYNREGERWAGAYLDACESGDLHTSVAQMTWDDLGWPEPGSPPEAFRKVADQIFYRQDSYRQMAKKLGHGTNFVGQPRTMAMHTKTPEPIIANFQARYFRAFPCIPAYHDWVAEQLAETSNLITLHGRRRFFFGRANDATTLREAVAYCPQSMTADAVNKAMIAIWRAHIHRGANRVQILCQVHDSLLMQAPTELVDDVMEELLELGKAPLRLKGDRDFVVPNEAKIGFNWGDEDKDNNPLGLIKWKASKPDTRKPDAPRKLLSIQDILWQER